VPVDQFDLDVGVSLQFEPHAGSPTPQPFIAIVTSLGPSSK
jgi:hypothetical protein